MNSLLTIAGVLVGDIERDREARIKYGHLFDFLRERFRLLSVHDVSLRGPERWRAALHSFRLDRRQWREHFHKNTAAFHARSRRAARLVGTTKERPAVVLQLGGMFDSRSEPGSPPAVIYTDYTAALSRRRREGGRSPHSARELDAWLRIEGRTYRRAFHVCSRSNLVRRSLMDDYGLPESNVSTIGGGVNFSSLPELRRESTATEPTALFVGLDFLRKGGDLLLRAFARARSQVAEARLIVVTADSIPDDLPLAGVTVLGPVWDRGKLGELYRQADLLVLPSRLETWGDVLLEAMAYGLPCIGVRGEAMEEIFADGESGVLVGRGDESELANALIELLGDTERRGTIGLAARRRVEAEFTWERVVDRLAPLLEAAGQTA